MNRRGSPHERPLRRGVHPQHCRDSLRVVTQRSVSMTSSLDCKVPDWPFLAGPEEEPAVPTEVTAIPGGPLLLRGDLHIRAAGVDVHETRAALCSCGSARNAPCCDAAEPAPTGRTRVANSRRSDSQAMNGVRSAGIVTNGRVE